MRQVSREEAISLLDAEGEALPPRFNGCAMCAVAAAHPGYDEAVNIPRDSAFAGPSIASNACAVAVLDRYALRRGHVLVVLRRHVESIVSVPWDEYAEVQRLSWQTARALDRVLRPKRLYVAALGSPVQLPMSFPHHHVHVVPLPDGGEEDKPSEVFSWRRGVLMYDEGEAEELVAALAAAMEA